MNDVIRRLWNDGRTDREIAAATGLTPKAVKGRRHRAGLVTPVEPIDRDQVRRLYEAQCNAREIAELMGRPRRTMEQVLWQLGLKTRSGRRCNRRR